MNQDPREPFHSGTTIVTSSARLSRRRHWQHTCARVAAGERAWETPDILPWQAWLERTWEARRWQDDDGVAVLRPAQRRVLWQQIVESSPQRRHLLQPAAVAARAIEAWETLHAWGVPEFPDHIHVNDDAGAFRAWAGEYRRRCVEGAWVDPAQLPAALARAVRAGAPRARGCLRFAGFDEPAPALRDLIAALSAAGADAALAPPRRTTGRAVRAGFRDRRAEWVAAVRWARHCLERDPEGSVGIVVPGLSALRAGVHDICVDVLAPESLCAVSEGWPAPFSIAAGEPLAAQPAVAHALLLLAWVAGPIPAVDVSALLRSPYLRGADAEAPARARLDAALRSRRDPQPPLDAVLATGACGGPDGAAALLRGLGALQESVRRLPARQRATQWAAVFAALLDCAGWPGDRAFTSSEYQVLTAWRELLGEFASLDAVTGSFGLGVALGHLRRLAAERAFQPQTPEAPIQIVDMAGVADMGFDHLWITGLHEDAWPPVASPNPFIPVALQREYAMPRASAEHELARARRMTAAMLCACPDVVVSWPRQDGESMLGPSPLLHGLDEDDPPLGADPHWIPVVFAARRIETFVDGRGPALPAGREVHGGAAVFRDQAACPFRAFARHRLRAAALDEADVGLDAMDRGILVHDLMQRIWQRLGSHEGLRMLSGPDLDALVAEAVERTVAAAAARRPRVFGVRFAGVERARLVALAREWLDLERARAPFTVTGCEVSRPFRLGGIAGSLRMDRVDRMPDGREVIIDYKTGRLPGRPWDGARPEDPQLPLYAVTGEVPPAAVAFARVARGECGFSGAGAAAGLLPGVRAVTGWDRQIEDWRRALADLGRDFERGVAAVDPRDGTTTCGRCDVQPFCRVHELNLPPEADSDDDGQTRR